MELPWLSTSRLEGGLWADMSRRAIFECCKWDPQVGDQESLASFPLILRASAWSELAHLAERLSQEILAAERELVERPELHRALALPRAVRCSLARGSPRESPRRDVRVLRLDFHFTAEGWRISEANTDVPGGYNEASGFTGMMARHFAGARACGDPAAALVQAIARVVSPGSTVALVHATAYTDDRQVMVFLARLLESQGIHTVLVAPDHVIWRDGRAGIQSSWHSGPADLVLRFFPAEWLPSLPRRSGWHGFIRGSRTPLCNPASALLTQSKRLPLIWDHLQTDMRTWRRMLPETRDPREVSWRGDPGWVVKPALGRVGEMIGLHGVTSASDWARIRKSLRWHARHWIVQRRFDPVPLEVPGGRYFPCFGVYTIDGKAAGAYGRAAQKPLIDHQAQDAAVLVEEVVGAGTGPQPRGELIHGYVRAF